MEDNWQNHLLCKLKEYAPEDSWEALIDIEAMTCRQLPERVKIRLMSWALSRLGIDLAAEIAKEKAIPKPFVSALKRVVSDIQAQLILKSCNCKPDFQSCAARVGLIDKTYEKEVEPYLTGGDGTSFSFALAALTWATRYDKPEALAEVIFWVNASYEGSVEHEEHYRQVVCKVRDEYVGAHSEI